MISLKWIADDFKEKNLILQWTLEEMKEKEIILSKEVESRQNEIKK